MDSSIADRWSGFDLGARTPLCEAMRSRRAVQLESATRVGNEYPNMLAETLAASISALASLPLISTQGAVLGAAGFGWPDKQQFCTS
jgi:hypothetical protein